MNPLIYVAFALLALVFFALSQLLLPVLYDFKITERGVEEVWLRCIRIRTIRFADITDVRVMQKSDWRAGARGLREYAGNRLWKSSRSVLIFKRRGLIRVIALTPKKPEDFVARVRAGIEGLRAARSESSTRSRPERT